MRLPWQIVFIITLNFKGLLTTPSLEEYMSYRVNVLSQELNMSYGQGLELTWEEELFNGVLMILKDVEMAQSFQTSEFPPAFSFLETWRDYDSSEVFQLLKTIPKGAILHIHDITMTSVDWLIQNATYIANLYYKEEEEAVEFRFLPSGTQGWSSLQERRETDGNGQVDSWLKQVLMMGTDSEKYQTVNECWVKFMRCLNAALGIITYKPVFVEYFDRALEEYLLDGVQYVELRSTLPPVYDLDGSSLTQLECALLYKDTADKFAARNPDWCGSKLIFAPIRHVPESTVVTDLEVAKVLQAELPEFFAGFDLVAQEDKGFPLVDFVEPLLEASEYMTYFFHAGETDWDWSSTDLNLADAILLNTSRIGHGYAIDKHPVLMEIGREKDIAIEVNPISNQVLGLVSDLRNHPAATLVKTSYPIVISSDDPSVWGSLPLSHDFYAAFMAFGGDSADLRMLKQLVMNSFRYSKMGLEERNVCLAKFENRWRRVIRENLYDSPDIGIV